MKKKLLAVLLSTMMVATFATGCGEAKDAAGTETKTEDKADEKKDEEKKDDAEEKKDDAAEEKKDDAAEEKADDAEEETAAAGEEDAEIYYADLSAALAGSSWVSTDEEIYLFGDDGSTFYVTDGDLEAIGTYAFEMLTDGEDGLMGITLSVVDDELGIDLEATYFVTELDEENSILYLIDEDGNEAAWVEAE